MSTKKKVQKTVTLDVDTLEFLQKGVDNKRFSSISHGIDFCVYEVKKKENKENLEE